MPALQSTRIPRCSKPVSFPSVNLSALCEAFFFRETKSFSVPFPVTKYFRQDFFHGKRFGHSAQIFRRFGGMLVLNNFAAHVQG
jgi:hypothetical protein